jgi:hypothetical protein
MIMIQGTQPSGKTKKNRENNEKYFPAGKNQGI